VTPSIAGEGITWEKDLEAAKSAAKRSNRLILIHFGATWCQPCQQLEREVFSAPDFGKDLKPNYVAVKLNYDNFPATAHQYGVGSLPCDVILAPNGQVIERMTSPMTSAEYVASLQRVAVYARTGQRPLPPQTATAVVAAPQHAPQQPAYAVPLNSAGVSSQPPMPNAAQTDNLYMSYYDQRRNEKQAATAAPYAQPYLAGASGPAPTGAPPVANTGAPAAAGPTDWLATQPPEQSNAGPQNAATGPQWPQALAAQSAAPHPSQFSQMPARQVLGLPVLPPGNPPLGLDGYCPVTLCEHGTWGLGDTRYGMQHRGRTYLFSGPEELKRFRDNPDRYSPVLAGNDPVLELDQGQSVPGNRMYGLYCRGHIYLFASEETLQRFRQNENRYSTEALQARR